MNTALHNEIQDIFVDNIDDPQNAMRSEIDRDGLFDLAEDIKKNGLINPITVRPVLDRYEVVAGHRRLSACKIAGLIKIPCVVRDVDDAAAFGIMASENLVREDVDPVDEANFILNVMEKTNQSSVEIAKTLRRTVAYINDRLLIASMPYYMQEGLKNKSLKIGAALNLFQIKDEEKRRLWVGMAIRDGISVRQAEYWLYQWNASQLPDAVRVDDPLSYLKSDQPEKLMFVCSIDGEKYPVEDTLMVCIAKKNIEYLKLLRSEINKDTV